VIAATAIAAWLAPGLAAADLIVGVDPECPEGSRPRRDHLGAFCEPTACDPDQGCGDAGACRSKALCVETERYHPRGDRGAENIRRIARGPCEPDGSCVRPAVCESAPRCGSGADTPSWRDRARCAAAPGIPELPATASLGALLAAAAAAWRRRRRGR
jgi:hypothetical protein